MTALNLPHRVLDLQNRVTLMASLPHGGRVAEIGVERGDFAAQILDANKPATLWLVDCWQKQAEEVYGKDPINHGDTDFDANLRYVMERFGNTNVLLKKAFSVDAAIEFGNETFDIVYIDANHLCAAEDIAAWWPKVKVGGWLCGHDYMMNEWCTVQAAVNHFAQANRLLLHVTKDHYPSWAVQKTTLGA